MKRKRTCDLRARSERGGPSPAPPSPNKALNIAIATGGHGWRLLPPLGRRHGERAVQARARHAGDKARVTGGSVDNLKLIGSQQSEGRRW